jgi:hypothetical protein
VALIIDKMEQMGRLDELTSYWPVKNWLTSRDGGPRTRIREDLKQ